MLSWRFAENSTFGADRESYNTTMEVEVMKKGVALFLIILTVAVCAEAAKDRWVLLGRKTVSFGAERDVIRVTGWRGEFKRIQIYVRETGVHFADINVVFANGRTVDVPIRSFIPEGGRSRIIDLPGKARVIQRITLVYATRIGARDKALVEVWGLRD